MSLRINDTATNFMAEATQGATRFHEPIGDGRAILFSHPENLTPVCTAQSFLSLWSNGEFLL